MTQLPIISGAAQLPATYTAAQKAIAALDSVDECKSWADKAAALASYARQAKDDTLRVMAVRIQARAHRRAGELLKLIAPANGARTDLHPAPTRGSAASSAGLSERQSRTAIRLAGIPADEFEAAIEVDKPPSLTELSREARSVPGSSASASPLALIEFADFCARVDPSDLAARIPSAQVEAMRRCVALADRWLDGFVSGLGG